MHKSIESSSASVSPLTTRLKNSSTPLRSKCRTSRRELGINVNASCSTPRTQCLTDLNSVMNSPISYSQDSPDVVWDYNSPKPLKGTKKKKINITIEEFLKNLNQQKISECNTQSSQYIKLLEKWMTHQHSTIAAKKISKTVKGEKKRSKKVIAEIKQFMDSIQSKNIECNAKEKISENMASENHMLGAKEMLNISSASLSSNKKLFIDENSECDSSDELWGDLDNSFLIKATQDLEGYNLGCTEKNFDFISVIPETISSSNTSPSVINQNIEVLEKPNCMKKAFQNDKELESQTEYILTQLLSCNWDSESDDDWDNGFILEDDDLNQIPDDVLSGNILIERKNSDESPIKQETCENIFSNTNDMQIDVLLDADESNMLQNIELNNKVTESTVFSAQNENNSGELFNNFDDVNFGDESILCKPEVLSWIDEVENQLTQKCSPESLKCTPEEIEKKKDEALRRRKGKKFTT